MRFSQLFSKTLKNVPADCDSLNDRLLTRAGYIHQEVAGVYTFLPLGLKVLTKIENIVREEMDAIGGAEILMPGLAPKEYWEATGRLETIDVLFKVMGGNKKSQFQNDKEYVLNPTHEEVVTPVAKNIIFSYKDLPLLPYQLQTKYRNEPRSRGGLLRGREFRMKDLYSFHADGASFQEFYKVIGLAYKKIFTRFGLADKTYYTYASGGDFTEKYSHEFQTVMEGGEDTIYICEHCSSDFGVGLAYNKEVVLPNSAEFKCLHCGKSDFRVEKACEVGNIFPLETRFPKAFDLKYSASDGSLQYPIMGSYGLGTSRVVGVLAEVFGDALGLNWPKAVSPYDIHLVSLTKETDRVQNVYDQLVAAGMSVLWDDRIDVSAGEKLADADLIGITTQVIVSSRSLEKGGVEVRLRSGRAEDPKKAGEIVSIESLVTVIPTL